MLMKTAARLALAVICLIVIAGCGNSDTNGTLSLALPTKDNGGVVTVTPTATFSSSASSLVGLQVTITTKIYTLSGSFSNTYVDTPSTDTAGVATAIDYNIQRTNEAVYVESTAVVGHLKSSQSTVISAL